MPFKHNFRFLKHGSYWAYRVATWVVLAAGLGWALAVVALRYLVLPNIDDYREPILHSVSEATGQTVEIARIEGDWRNYWPVLRFYDVRVHEAGGQQTLALDRVDTELSWRTLIAGKIVFGLIEFSGSNVEVRRDSLGTLWLAGKAIERKPPEARSRLMNWLFAQREIVVKGAQVTWIDEMRAAPVMLISDVNLRIKNDGRRHRLSVTGNPPAELASPVTLSGEFFGNQIEDFSGRGRLYAEFDYANLAVAQQWLALPVDFDSGLGVLRLWIDIENRMLRRVTADGDLVNVAGRLGKELDTFALTSLSGRVQWDEDATAETIAMSDLTLEAVDGVRLAPANISFTRPRAAESRRRLRIRSLELAPLAGLSRFLPVNAEIHEKIARWQPNGVIDELNASWLPGKDGPQGLIMDGRFHELALKSVDTWPGFSGMSGSMSMSKGVGTVALKTERAALDYPHIFAEPIPFDYLDADARWQYDAEQFRVTVDSLAFTNEHAAGKANGSYFFPGTGRGEIDLRAVLVRAEARHVWRYFPNAIETTRTWLKQGMVSGVSDKVRLHFAGPLDKFPFDSKQEGILEISASVRDATVRIGEDWPLIERVDGEFLVNGDRIDIAPRSGMIMGADVSQSKVAIMDLGRPGVRLSLDGKAAGQVEQYLRFVANSPVAKYTGGVTQDMRGKGIGNLGLRLDLPFFNRADIAVEGTLDLAGPVFSVDPRAPQLTDYALRVEFDKGSVALRNGRAHMLGGPVRFNSVASQEGTRAFSLGGVVEARELAAFTEIGMLDKLNGRAEWNGRLSFDKAGSHLRVESTLVGIGSRLPGPLDKLEPIALPLRFDTWSKGEGHREYAVRLDKVGSARLASKGGKAERGEIVFGGEAVLPQQGEIVARGELTALDYDGWREIMADSRPADAPAATEHLDVLDLKIGRLLFGGRSFRDLRITGKKIQETWQLGLAGPQIEGNMVVASDADGAQRINARFKSLLLEPNAPSITVPVARQQAKPARRIPAAFNVIVEALEYEGRPLGRLELLAEPIDDGWRVDRLAVSNPDGRMDVKGAWRIAGRPYAEYTVRFEALDNGKFLERLGHPDTVVGGTGSLTGPVSWLGGPFRPDLPTLNGKLKLEAGGGRFAQVDPGAAQLIGILSLQALPRRITLNFKDVFSTGFSFDRIEADVTVSEGVATTEDFRMDGVAAEVTMKGEVNLVAKSQDLEVHVKPMLSGAAAVAGATIINPLVGVAALLVQKALGDPIEEAASRDYRVTGTWGNPQVERIQRQPASSNAPK